MNIIEEYIDDSCLAVSKLIYALSSFEQEILRSLVKMTKTNEPQEQTDEMKNIYSQFIPREAIAGAILQISFMCMRLFPKKGNKNEIILYLEDKIKDSTGKAYSYPIQYCVGR
jgi:hypothetical protein